MQTKIPCKLMRGGTSKGAYFLASDLPDDTSTREKVLLAVMGSPDPRQIDGVGGSTSLTSKVAIVQLSKKKGADLDYLFTQVSVNEPQTSVSQNCGNLLAGVGPFAIEQGLITPTEPETTVTVYMQNTDSFAEVTFATKGGDVNYNGKSKIDGVPGTGSPVMIKFRDTEGSTCGSLLPTGNLVDRILEYDVTCIDNGMPVVLIDANDLNCSGYETREKLDSNKDLKNILEQIRIEAGKIMNLGDISEKTIPKMTLVSPPKNGGTICTRSFIPHDCHASIGVLAAVSVATASTLKGTVPYKIAEVPDKNPTMISVEHPSGELSLEIEFKKESDCNEVNGVSLLRTTRLLFEGLVSIPRSVWDGMK